MKLSALPAFADNYIWMLHDGREAVVVDPGEAAPVQDALQRLGLTLAAILVTHRHADHVGGLAALQTGEIPVYGPRHEAIPGVTHAVAGGEDIEALGARFQVINAPGHTAGHVLYMLPDGLDELTPSPVAFVGDTLFSAGCGRVFDGTVTQLQHSIAQMTRWPDSTVLCPAHEYTLGNLRFAQAVEPDNEDIRGHLAHCQGLRAQDLPTLPTTVHLERKINPFLRCTEAAVIQAARLHGALDDSPEAVFAALRLWKNTF